jgi:hypothetical protein
VAELPLDEAIPRLRSNEDRFDQFVNGGTSTSFTTTGSVAVPSIRKFLNDKNTEINVSATGILAQTTTAKNTALQAQADAETAAGNAADSEAAAAGSASAAAGSASNASDSEVAAQQAKVDSQTAAGNAADSELAAQQAKVDAETAAGHAADSEAAAAGSASDAADSAGTALSAKGAAESARDTALAAFANFQDQYLGALPDEPTTDLDGSALDGGELYFNTTNGVMNVYTTDAGWVAAYVSATGIPLIANNGSEYDPATFRTNLSLYSKTQIDDHTNATNNPHGVTKEQVGLGDVDNTADAAKPVSTAQAEAIAERVKLSSTTVQPLSGGLSQAVVTLTPVAGVLTLDFSLGNHFKATLTANTSLVVANLPAVGTRQEFTLDVIQDATGGRTLSYASAFKWPGRTAAPSITTTANAINTLTGFANDSEVVTAFAGAR